MNLPSSLISLQLGCLSVCHWKVRWFLWGCEWDRVGGTVEEKKATRRSKAISSLSFHLSHVGDFILTRPRTPGRYQRDHLRLKLNDSNKRCGPPLPPPTPMTPTTPRHHGSSEERRYEAGWGGVVMGREGDGLKWVLSCRNCRRGRWWIHTPTSHRYAHTAGTKSDTNTHTQIKKPAQQQSSSALSFLFTHFPLCFLSLFFTHTIFLPQPLSLSHLHTHHTNTQ